MASLTFNGTLRLTSPRTISVIPLQLLGPYVLDLVTDVTPTTCLCLSLLGMFNALSPPMCVAITLPRTLPVDPLRMSQDLGLSYFLNPLFVLLGRTFVLLLLTIVRNLDMLPFDTPVVPVTILDICLLVPILVKLLVPSRLDRTPMILVVPTRAPNVHEFGQSAVLVVVIVEANVDLDPMTLVPIRPCVTLVVFRLALMANAALPLFELAQLLTRTRELPVPTRSRRPITCILKKLLMMIRTIMMVVVTTAIQ